MAVLPARTFLMGGKNMLEIDGSLLSPLCHPLWQEFQGKRAIMPVPQGVSQDSGGLCTLTSAGLADGEPAWAQELCSPTSTRRADVSWVRPHAVICDQRPATLLSVTHLRPRRAEMGMKCPHFQLSHVSVQQFCEIQA